MDYARLRQEALDRRQEVDARIEVLLEQRLRIQIETDQLRRERAGLDQILEGTESANSDEPLEGEPSGASDQVRRLLQQTPDFLLPTEIRDRLNRKGITGSSAKHLLIAIHNVLTRLDGYLETTEINNRTAYRWKRKEERDKSGDDRNVATNV
jgi:hypothetical protein